MRALLLGLLIFCVLSIVLTLIWAYIYIPKQHDKILEASFLKGFQIKCPNPKIINMLHTTASQSIIPAAVSNQVEVNNDAPQTLPPFVLELEDVNENKIMSASNVQQQDIDILALQSSQIMTRSLQQQAMFDVPEQQQPVEASPQTQFEQQQPIAITPSQSVVVSQQQARFAIPEQQQPIAITPQVIPTQQQAMFDVIEQQQPIAITPSQSVVVSQQQARFDTPEQQQPVSTPLPAVVAPLPVSVPTQPVASSPQPVPIQPIAVVPSSPQPVAVAQVPVASSPQPVASSPQPVAVAQVPVVSPATATMLLRRCLTNANSSVLGKILFDYKANELKTASKVLMNMGMSNETALVRLGIRAGMHVGASVVNISLTNPFVDGRRLAMEVLFSQLDVSKIKSMSLADIYKKIKNSVDAQMKLEIESNGGEYPLVIGPLDKLSESEVSMQIVNTLNNVMSDLNHPLLSQIVDKLNTDIYSGVLTSAHINNPMIMNSYYDLIDRNAMSKFVLESTCSSIGGKVIRKEDGSFRCSYADANACHANNNLTNSGDTYAEFKSDQYGGACVVGSYTMKKICEDSNLTYDMDTGLCNGIDDAYCKTHGGEMIFDNNTNSFVCGITGKLLTNTILKGVDMKYQQCNNNEEEDGPFCKTKFCKDDNELVNGRCLTKCEKGYDPVGSSCESLCPYLGFIVFRNKRMMKFITNTSSNPVIEMMPPGVVDNGLMLSNIVAFDPKDGSISLLNNSKKCFEVSSNVDGADVFLRDRRNVDEQRFDYISSAGVICLRSNHSLCLDSSSNNLQLRSISLGSPNQLMDAKALRHMRTEGNKCTLQGSSTPASCPPGFSNTNGQCVKPESSITMQGRRASCPSGYTFNGTSCVRPVSVLDNGTGRTPDCASGFKWNSLMRSCVQQITPQQRIYPATIRCPSNSRIANGVCVNSSTGAPLDPNRMVCPANTTRVDSVCVANCEPGDRVSTVNNKECVRALKTDQPLCKTGEVMFNNRCYPRCATGFINTEDKCVRPMNNLGVSSMTCNSNEHKDGSMCYPRCSANARNVGDKCITPEESRSSEVMFCDNANEERIGDRCFIPVSLPFSNVNNLISISKDIYQRGNFDPAETLRFRV